MNLRIWRLVSSIARPPHPTLDPRSASRRGTSGGVAAKRPAARPQRVNARPCNGAPGRCTMGRGASEMKARPGGGAGASAPRPADSQAREGAMLPFEKSEYVARIAKTKRSMEKAGIEVLIASQPASMNYLTGYDGWSFYVPQVVGPGGGGGGADLDRPARRSQRGEEDGFHARGQHPVLRRGLHPRRGQ